jgi:hypothetical protein
MRGDPSVWLVVDREDSVEFAAFVDRLACPSAGRVVCHPTPDDPSGGWLAIDLLLALGKQADGPRAERIRGRSWQLAETWLRAEEVKHLFVLRAHLLSARALNCLLALPRSAALDLWLIAARPDLRPAARGMLNQIAWQRMSRTRFTHRWRQSVGALPPNFRPSDAAVFPDVPETDFPTFRAACRRLLEPVGFARVDRLYRTVMDQTLRWLDAHARILSHLWELELQAQDFERFVIRGHYYVERRAQVLHTFERTWSDFEHALASYLQDVASSSGSPEEMLVRLRGAQAACFHHGLLLRFTLTPQALAGQAHLGPTLDERTTMRLRGLCTPKFTAAATLALVLGRGPAALASLKIGSISAGTGRIEHRRESFTMHLRPGA